MTYNPECGDIFLCDSDQVGAKIVKFLQQSPTVWQQIWRFFTHRLEEVRFYHAGMIIDDLQIIEQQWKVQYADINKIFDRRIIIYRMKHLGNTNMNIVRQRAIEDIGKIYDIPQLIGKTLTWLTGIKWFVRFLGKLSKEEEICVTRVGDWYENICDFGVRTKHEITTKVIDDYCRRRVEEWEIVYQNKV